jgi:hypothetical protein
VEIRGNLDLAYRIEGQSVVIAVFEKQLPSGWALENSAHASINQPVGKGC